MEASGIAATRLSASDVARLLGPDGAPLPGAPLGMLLTAQAAIAPERAALTVGDLTLSRAQLDERANRRARQLASLGVRADDIVLIALPNGFEFYETAFAAFKLGATVAPVSHRLTARESEQIVELAGARLVIGGVPVPSGTPVLPGGTLPDQSLDGSPLPPAVARHWKIGTSGGSTGRPKLIVDVNPGHWSHDKEGRRRLPGSTIINPAPLFHAAPFNNMLLALAQGSHIIEMGSFDAATYVRLVERHGADWAYLVPTMMSRIIKLPEKDRTARALRSLRTILHMAAPCPIWVKQAWIDIVGPGAVLELYGGAERIGLTLIDGHQWLAHRGSVGRPISGEVGVFDDDWRPCPPHVVGDIHFRPGTAGEESFAYIGAEARERDSWRSYGDIGWLDEDGYVYIADRRVDLIVTGGANVYPAEIEAAIGALPNVVGAVVIGLPDEDLGQRVHAIVQLESDAPAMSHAQLIAGLSDEVQPYKLPRSSEFTTAQLRDEAGKVRRSALRQERIAATGRH